VSTNWVIDGMTEDGRRFRPSDWVDRISTALASFGPDHRLRYSEDVRPCFIEGRKCLLVKKHLEKENPTAYEYVCSFVRTNGLRMDELQTVDSAA
jgi:hypothetical protein